MNHILQINTSLFGNHGQSSQLADRLVGVLRAQHQDATVTVRDLAREPVPHLDGERFGAFTTPAAQRTPAQQAVVDFSDALIDELRRADTLVLGLPMYNFGVPSQLKAWFDHIARAGETFRYTEKGPEGLLTGKKAYVLATRGGRHAGTALDTETAYVRDFLRFLGIADVQFVYAEGLAMGDAPRQAGLEAAQRQIEELAPQYAIAA